LQPLYTPFVSRGGVSGGEIEFSLQTGENRTVTDVVDVLSCVMDAGVLGYDRV
jgi:hypothetical protein